MLRAEVVEGVLVRDLLDGRGEHRAHDGAHHELAPGVQAPLEGVEGQERVQDPRVPKCTVLMINPKIMVYV